MSDRSFKFVVLGSATPPLLLSLGMCLSWAFSVGSPCEGPAQLGPLENVDSKPTSRTNHAAEAGAVAVGMLRSHSEGCELLQPFAGAHPDPRLATSQCRVYSRSWCPSSGISPDSYVRGGFLVYAPLSGQADIYVLKCDLNSHPQHSHL